MVSPLDGDTDATGDTSAGKEMLEICGKAYTILKEEIPDLEMICVSGELFDRKPPALASGVNLFTHIPKPLRTLYCL